MNETNFDWDDLRLFLAIARNGGLAVAADITGKSAPTLGRRMLALERRLGQELFVRLPRGYELTEQGKSLMQAAVNLESEIAPILPVDGQQTLRRVKISAGTWVTHQLCNHVEQLIRDDSVIVQFIAADHQLDIAHREAVIGIRNQRPTQANLAGRQTSRINFAVYAINEHIATWVCTVGTTPSAQWVRKQTGNSSCIEVTHPRNALDLAVAGAAKAVLPTFIGSEYKALQQVSGEIEELEHMQWLVTHHEDRHLPEVRIVIDRVHAILSARDSTS